MNPTESELNRNQFYSHKISAELVQINVKKYDPDVFAQNFREWLVNEDSQLIKNSHPNNQNKTAIVFKVDHNLEIDSADLALILEVARQESLVPLGFINTSKLVSNYTAFANLALFDSENLNLSEKPLNTQAIPTPPISPAVTKEQEEEIKQSNPIDEKSLQPFESRLNEELFLNQPPDFINHDISEKLHCKKVTFINGDVFLPAVVSAEKDVYIYGCCFGQVSVASSDGKIFIQKLRARRIRIGSMNLESGEYPDDLIDQSVLFFVNNHQIQTKLISQINS